MMNLSRLTPSCKKAWLGNVPISTLVFFRLIWGSLMLISTARFMLKGWVDDHFVQPAFQFKYFGFHWVELAPPWAMYAMHYLMVLAALGIIFGAFYRFSAFVFFVLFTYGELVDITYYLNHYYFVSLVSFWMIIVPANRAFSLDVKWKWTTPASHVPAWSVLIFKLQLGIVYFYAGIAKLNTDWMLRGLPLNMWLPARDYTPIIGPYFKYPIVPLIFSWLGMLYDVCIPFLLWMRRTRIWAYMAVIAFHSMTGYFFQIGVFPTVMTAATLIFFEASFHEKALKFIGWEKTAAPVVYKPRFARAIHWGLGVYIAFQLLFPWRYLLYPNNIYWSEDGYRFAWRVMLMEKAGSATFYVKDGESGREGIVENADFLTKAQEKQMAMQPDLILQFANFLKEEHEARGMRGVTVRAEVYVTLNGRPSRLYFDPQLDLTKVKDSFAPRDWLYPFDEEVPQ